MVYDRERVVEDLGRDHPADMAADTSRAPAIGEKPAELSIEGGVAEAAEWEPGRRTPGARKRYSAVSSRKGF